MSTVMEQSWQVLSLNTVRQDMESRESNLKAVFSKATGDLELEIVAHADTLLKLSRTRNELQMAKDAWKSLDEKMLKMLDDHEKELKEVAVQYTLIARISIMLEPAEQKATWNVQEEIRAFKLKFPNSSLEEWGVPEVVDNPKK